MRPEIVVETHVLLLDLKLVHLNLLAPVVSKVGLVRSHVRLDKLERKLILAVFELGDQAIDHWLKLDLCQSVGIVPPVSYIVFSPNAD